MSKFRLLLPDLAMFADTCQVYVARGPDGCVAVDFGSGAWLRHLPRLKWGPLQHVYLTHAHAEQCHGLASRRKWPFVVHAPAACQKLLAAPDVKAYWRSRRTQAYSTIPPLYDMLQRGLSDVRFDLSGFTDQFWGSQRIRLISTPGHGTDAVSLLMDLSGRQVVFCGDAAHAGGRLWQPYHLEWDHWTAGGALAALEGVKRLQGLAIDLLCPSHGPVVERHPRAMLTTLRRRLERFADAKGNICPGEPDRYLTPTLLPSGARQLLPHLIQFGSNSYLVISPGTRRALLVDPLEASIPMLDQLLADLGDVRLTDMTATHYHIDHVDGIPSLRRRGVKLWLHPLVAEALARTQPPDKPFLPRRPIKPDALLPEHGTWRWQDLAFRVAHYPGQTWWHAAMMATLDGRKVFFGGDSFQPNSRWNGTGGFCSYNGSRFEGFIASTRLIRRWKPDWVVNGHNTYHRYAASQYVKIERWARAARRATRDLCPGGKLKPHYHLHPH